MRACCACALQSRRKPNVQAVGLGSAFGLIRLIAGFLYGVEPTEPSVFVLVAAVPAMVALAACLIPARRAARVNVVTALRCE